MNDLTAIAIAGIAAIPPTLVAWGALRQSQKNAAKSDEIHVLVNSNLASVKADLKIAQERIEKLEALLTKEAR